MHKHRVIDGRIYRDVELEAADTRAAARHISSQRPEILTPAARTLRMQLEIAR